MPGATISDEIWSLPTVVKRALPQVPCWNVCDVSV